MFEIYSTRRGRKPILVGTAISLEEATTLVEEAEAKLDAWLTRFYAGEDILWQDSGLSLGEGDTVIARDTETGKEYIEEGGYWGYYPPI